MPSLLPKRPWSKSIQGEFHASSGATYGIEGRASLSEANDLTIEGYTTSASSGTWAAPVSGSFQGSFDDGSELSLPYVHVEHMNVRFGSLGGGWEFRLAALGHGDWQQVRAAGSDPETTSIRVTWTLSHAPLLWHAAKKFYYYDGDRMAAVGTHDWPARLLLLSTALESLKALYLRGRDGRRASSPHQREILESLRAHLRSIWKDEYGTNLERSLIMQRMADVFRPTYRATLEGMVRDWNVPLDGLDDPFGFIRLRNTVTHTGQVPGDNYQELADATDTLEALFERTMGCWLELPAAAFFDTLGAV